MSPSVPCANVYDIRSLKEIPDFKYFFDTNFLKFVFARTFVDEKGYQVKFYPQFFRKLLKQKCLMFTFTQNVLELCSVMDKIEETFIGKNIKEYRKETIEQYLLTRKDIYDEIKNSLNIFPTTIETSHIEAYFEIDYSIDLFDYIYFQLAKDGETAFVTDDQEFIFIDGITVFTANRNAIYNASKFKKLIN
jgi:hypothetical protein